MNTPRPTDIKLQPTYPLAVAARYVGANPSTLRAWLFGRTYVAAKSRRQAAPALTATHAPGVPISFLDLVEAHVLLTIRLGCHIPMRRFRTAVEYLRKEMGDDLHRLARRDFCHDKRDLFIRLEHGKLLSLSERGQYVDEMIMADGLRQLQYGDDDYVGRFFPRFEGQGLQNRVVLDPTVNFGRPCLSERGIDIDVIARRFRVGEKIAELAEDYGLTPADVKEALRWHERLAA